MKVIPAGAFLFLGTTALLVCVSHLFIYSNSNKLNIIRTPKLTWNKIYKSAMNQRWIHHFNNTEKKKKKSFINITLLRVNKSSTDRWIAEIRRGWRESNQLQNPKLWWINLTRTMLLPWCFRGLDFLKRKRETDEKVVELNKN